MRRAKVVCTLGPATSRPETVRALVDAGLDVARINFSHGSDHDHRAALDLVRGAAKEAGRVVAALADLSGPKVRIGEVTRGHIALRPGMRFELRSGGGPGDETGVSTSHPGLGADLRPGDRVLLADGAVELVVRSAGDPVVTEVVKAARDVHVSSHAGLNAPAERLSLPPITDKDRADLVTALDLGFDLVAQSFVRSSDDVRSLRELMGERPIPIVAKVETRPAVEQAEAIAEAADGLMIARGDLGVELPMEEVPVVQKELIRTCRLAGVPSIVATQMLESMVGSPRPTRAEASDVANAVLDGTDAIMLSAETAVGAYPLEAAQTAVRVAELAEERGGPFRLPAGTGGRPEEGRSIARAAADVVRSGIDVAAVACFTKTGRTASLVAAERPEVPLFAFSSHPARTRALATVWGVSPIGCAPPGDVDGLIQMMDRRLVEAGLLADGAIVVMVAAAPVGRAHTNLLKVHRLGSAAYGATG